MRIPAHIGGLERVNRSQNGDRQMLESAAGECKATQNNNVGVNLALVIAILTSARQGR